uniref:ATP synthase subunit a n=1 Tax=Ecnomus latus TaxID=623472 RepID=A0A9E8LNU2_9NEOP|nr:ATP synthase F0 subunit 6 [Ecnomus latus]UZZ43900.1 ATP synthase F0 subunit 6 [Ecnomus latus]
MMTNLFSIFDPTSTLNLNWLTPMMLMIILFPSFYISYNRINISFKFINLLMINEFKINIKTNKFIIIIMNMFFFIWLSNLYSIFPYIFSTTSHLQYNIIMAMPIWLSIIIMGWMLNMNHMFSHLVPQSTPIILIPFMVCIEMISNIIRPITLTVRLTANLIAGHLLLTLLSKLNMNINMMLVPMIIITQIILLMLELSVAMIQAYVFTILLSLYFLDIN